MSLVDVTLNDNMLPRSRTRKLSLDHHSNSLLMDANGNTRQFKRLSSLTELSLDETTEKSDEIVESPTADPTSPKTWENTIITQIHSLIKNVQISDTLVDYINREVLGGSDANANVGQRTRRKSCFTLSNDTLGNISEYPGARTRRQSVANKASSLPRRKVSSAGLNEFLPPPNVRRNSVVSQNGRRNSVVNSNPGRRESMTSVGGPRTRRNSVQHDGQFTTNPPNGGRRNSVAHTYNVLTRRVSLAHAYENSAMAPQRRMSYAHGSIDASQLNAGPQRRRSSVKPPCFPVTKISSVQKRLNKLYRRHKRNERASVNIKDVKSAFKNIRKAENNGVSDSGTNSDANIDNDVDVDENSNPCEYSDVSGLSADESANKDITDDTIVASVNTDVNEANSKSDDNSTDVTSGEIPAPRRKTSIQVRAWELSRRLRQRRRERRKGFVESDLI